MTGALTSRWGQTPSTHTVGGDRQWGLHGGRGKRQSTDEATLLEAIDHVLKEQRVESLRTVAWERQVERHTHYVGRGRGSATREQRVRETIRSHITHIARREGPIADLIQRFGWKAFVPNATSEAV